MNRSRGTGAAGCRQQRQAAPVKANRLSRSFRLTQTAEPPQHRAADFKTPTRVQRPAAAAAFSGESPSNESDQQDIIWDATSPSPHRAGKRGKKVARVVNISEIVSRIAPKHGRPTVTEPTLQQWIGDSAAIPCTPDVQGPKPKKKSPRPNGVDDLLKLAKQFDFNMFRQDEEEEEEKEEEPHQRSLDILSGDVLEVSSASLPAGTGLDMEDDLDFLFDEPTQRLSGKLSPASPASKAPAVSTATAKDEFDDDWENDDLLNDSLVLEMTQNPLKFTSPKCCSTQKTSGQLRRPDVPDVSDVRTSFSLETKSGFCWTNPAAGDVSSHRGLRTSVHQPNLLDEDLSSFFSADLVWDDPADDELLREICEDVENHMRNAENIPTKPAEGYAPNQRASLQPLKGNQPATNQRLTNQQPFVPQKQTAVAFPAGSSLAHISTPVLSVQRKDQFTFKKPNKPVSMVTSKGGVKCSAAEIELKKQQAMERRRQRLLAAKTPECR